VKATGSSVLLERENLASGIYVYQLIGDDGAVGAGKLIIE
jgi:hypothetical protein